MSEWKNGEVVYCWSAKLETFFKGMIEQHDDEHLVVRAFVNGKCYTFKADGSALCSDGRSTNQRVFSLQKLNEVF